MKRNNKRFFVITLMLLFIWNYNSVSFSQVNNYYSPVVQNNYTQINALYSSIKTNLLNDDFEAAKKDYFKLINQVENSTVSIEQKAASLNILNNFTRNYLVSKKDPIKKQKLLNTLKEFYKEQSNIDLKFADSYISSLYMYIEYYGNDNKASYGVLDLIDYILNLIQNGDFSKSDELFKVYSTYDGLLINNDLFKHSIHNRLKKTVELYTKLAEGDLQSKNTRLLPYLSMSLCCLGDFYLYNTTTDDAQKLYYLAYDGSISLLANPDNDFNSPTYYNHLYMLDNSFERLYCKYRDLNLTAKSDEVLLKIWNYYFTLLKYKYYKVTKLCNYNYFIAQISEYLYSNKKYEKFGNLYASIRYLSENNKEDFGLSQMQFRYEMLSKEGQIQPYNINDIKPNNNIEINNNAINIESAINFQKEAQKFLNYNSSYNDKIHGIELLKKSEYVYFELNKGLSAEPKNVQSEINLCLQIAEQSHNINGKDYIEYYFKAANIAETHKLSSYLPSLYKDIAIYYYQRENNNTLAEKYFDISTFNLDQIINKLTIKDEVEQSLAIPYLEASNFYVDTKKYNKVADCRAKQIKIYKFIYYKHPNFEATTNLIRWKNSYAEVLFSLKQYEKSKVLLLENIKMIKDLKVKNPDKISVLENISTHDLRLLGDVYLFTYNFYKAEETFINYIKTKEKIVLNKDVFYYKDFLGVYKKLVFIYQSTGQLKKENLAVSEMKLINKQISKLQEK